MQYSFIHNGETNVDVETMIEDYNEIHPEGINLCFPSKPFESVSEKLLIVFNTLTDKEYKDKEINLIIVSVVNACICDPNGQILNNENTPCALIWTAANHAVVNAVETGDENTKRRAGVLNTRFMYYDEL